MHLIKKIIILMFLLLGACVPVENYTPEEYFRDVDNALRGSKICGDTTEDWAQCVVRTNRPATKVMPPAKCEECERLHFSLWEIQRLMTQAVSCEDREDYQCVIDCLDEVERHFFYVNEAFGLGKAWYDSPEREISAKLTQAPIVHATPLPTRTPVPNSEPEMPQYDVDLVGMDYLDKISTIANTYETCDILEKHGIDPDCSLHAMDAMTKVVYPADCQNCEILHKNFVCMREKAVEIANAEGLAKGRAQMDYSHCENVANLVMDKIMGLRP